MRDLCIDERIILSWVLKKQDMRFGLDSLSSGLELVMGSCGCGNKLSISIKYKKYLVQQNNY